MFFLAFAYFVVGQASVTRNSAQTAADAAALAAARQDRDGVHDAFLAALLAGDRDKLVQLLADADPDVASACSEAGTFAGANRARVTQCEPTVGQPGYTVYVETLGSVGASVVKGSQDVYGTATATAVVQPRCTLGSADGHALNFTCDGNPLTVDPTAGGFTLKLSDFYTVHLTK